MSRLTVWHDGGCPLCRREIALMRRLDRNHAIEFVDASRGDACPRDRAELLARFHARENGRMLAVAARGRTSPVVRPLGRAARNHVVLAALDRVYALFLRARPALQRAARRLEQGRA